jgi:hypothetical protein
VNLNLSTPLQLIGRSVEFQRIIEILAKDGDLLITGVPGSGRRTLVRGAAQEVNTVILEIDCIRATDGERFVNLLAEAISQNWGAKEIEKWVNQSASEFFTFHPESKLKLLHSLNQKQLWQAFTILLNLLQIMAVSLDQRVLLILQSFPHIRSWDRHNLWESTFRQEIKSSPDVSYVLIATIAETSYHPDQSNYALEIIQYIIRCVLNLIHFRNFINILYSYL